MDETIDKLQIQISSDASEASDGLDQLIATLGVIRDVVAPATDRLREFSKVVSGLGKAKQGLNVEPMRQSLNDLAEAAKNINGIDLSGISEMGNKFSTLSQSFAGTDSNIGAGVTNFIEQLDRLGGALSSFSGSSSAFDVDGFRDTISGIGSAARSIADEDAARLGNLASVLISLNYNFGRNMAGLSTSDAEAFKTSIERIMEACNAIDENALGRLSVLSDALAEIRQAGGVIGEAASSAGSAGRSGGAAIGGLLGGGNGFASRALAEFKNIFGNIRRGVASELDSLGKFIQARFNGIGDSVRGIGGAMDWFKDRLDLSNTALGSFLSGLGRIAKYRLLRTIIKGFTSGAAEGLENLAHASEEANATLSRLSTSALLLKNSMGGTLYSALATAMDWITALADAAARAMDILSQFFAILGGRTTYMKATTAMQQYVDTTGKATSAVSALKQELMGFDEINSLTPDRESGGGAGGLPAPDYGAMFMEAPVSKWLQDMVNSGDFTAFGNTIAQKINEALGGINWDGIKSGAKKLVNSFTSALNGFFARIDGSLFGRTIGEALNTGALAVGKFWTDTNWSQIGTRVQEAIMGALQTVNPELLAVALVGKLNAIAQFVDSMLPANKADWLLIADRITEFITYALKYINWRSIFSAAKKLSDTMSNVLNYFFEGIDPSLIGETIANVINVGAAMVGNFFEQTKWDMIGSRAKVALLTAFDKINVNTLASAITGRVNAAIGLISGMLPDTPEELDLIAGKITDFINSALDGLNWENIRATAGNVATTLSGLLNRLFRHMDADKFGEAISSAINSATAFIGKFWSDTDWKVVGDKVKSALVHALGGINALDLAKTITGRFTAVVNFLSGLLPKTYAEWSVITDKISGLINFTIRNIPTKEIGETIGSVIMGGLRLIKSLSEDQTLTNIATALKNTLESAFNKITEDDIKEALSSVFTDIKNALKTLLTIELNIGEFKINAAEAAISAFALYTAIRGSLADVFRYTGFKSGNGFTLVGGVAFAIEALAKLSDISEAAENGSGLDLFSKVSDIASSALMSAGLVLHAAKQKKASSIAIGISAAFEMASGISDLYASADAENGVTKEKVAAVIGSALTKAGVMLVSTGHVVAGLITFGIGIGIEPVIKAFSDPFADAPSVTKIQSLDNWREQLDAVVQSAKSVEEILPVFQQITGINIDLEQFGVMLSYLGSGMGSLGDNVDPVMTAGAALEDFFEIYESAAATGVSFEEFAREQFSAWGIIIENTNGATDATQGFIDTASNTSSAVDALNQSLNETGSAVDFATNEFGELNNMDLSGANQEIGSVGTAFDDTVPHITAAGVEAENVNDKIVQIPSQTTVYIDIDNYTTLISNLDNINSKLRTITDSANALRLKVAIDLTNALSGLNTKINSVINSSLNSLNTMLGSTLIRSVNSFQSAINSLHGATIKISVNAGLSRGAKSFLSSLQNLDSSIAWRVNNLFRTSQFASGGYPATGQMFIANERGPELVGKIGNRTAVANEEQIGDAIFRYMDEYGDSSGGGMNYDALAAAMVSALRSAGVGAVYLDGRMLAQSINRETARAGRPAITY